jgi:perosamine synthetase
LALASLDIGTGHEVILPALTYVATANAVRYVGAEPVFVDSETCTGTLDPGLLDSLVTPRTRAIIPVHLHGHPADMEAVLRFADRHNLAVIEDAACALGARCRGRPVGTLGDAGCFSFYASKLITTGSGGMLVTNDAKLAARAARLSVHAQEDAGEYLHAEVGFNYRLSALQAALGLAQLEAIDRFLERKRSHAQRYDWLLAPVSGVIRPFVAPWATHSYGLYSIRLAKACPLSAAELRAALRTKGIDTRPLYVPLKDLPPYRACRSTPLPVARGFRQTGLTLPSSVGLAPSEVAHIAATIEELTKAT